MSNIKTISDVIFVKDINIGGTGDSSNGNLLSSAAGSTLVGDSNTYSGFTPASATIKGALSGVSTSLVSKMTTNFSNASGILSAANGGTGTTSLAAAIAALSPLNTKGDIWGFSTLNARVPVGTNGQVLTADSTNALGVSWAAPTGTVSSVNASVPPFMAVSGGPITTSGTLNFSFVSEDPNLFFASPDGTSGAPGFRAIVAADIPVLNQNTTGSAGSLSGIVSLASGGTGISAASPSDAFNALSPMSATGDILYEISPGVSAALPIGTTSQVLTVVAGLPAWMTPAATGVTNIATGTGLTGGPITSTGTISLADTAVTPGSYTNANITVDQQGRITSAASGSAGFANPMTTVGDLIFENATPAAARLPIGTTGQVLTVVAGLPAWTTAIVGANTALSNLTTTSINQDLTSQTVTAAAVTYNSGTSQGYDIPDNGPKLAETFTPGVSFSLSSMTLRMYSLQQGTGNIKIVIYTSSAGAPGVALGNSIDVPVTIMPAFTSSQDVVFAFATPVALTSGTQYWWSLEESTGFSGARDGVISTTVGAGGEANSIYNGSAWISEQSYTAYYTMYSSSGVQNLGTSSAHWNSAWINNIHTSAFQLTTSPTAGYVLTSDASGNGTWAAAAPAGVPIYANLAAFPGSATTGSLGVAADTGTVYEWNGTTWMSVGGTPSDFIFTNSISQDWDGTGAALLANSAVITTASFYPVYFGSTDVPLANTTTGSVPVVLQTGTVLEPTSSQDSAELDIKVGDNRGLGNTGTLNLLQGSISNAASTGNVGQVVIGGGGTNGTGLGGGIQIQGGNTSGGGNAGDITLQAGQAVVGGINGKIISKGHLDSQQATAPTATVNGNAGTGATSSVANATDTAGKVNLTLGSIGTLSAGVQTTVNFNTTYSVAPIVVITPTNAITASNVAVFGVYVTSTTAAFSINFATAGAATDVLQWNYYVIETQ